MSEGMSDLAVQLRLSAIYQELHCLSQQLESEREDPENGPMFAHLHFAERSLRNAAEQLNPTLVRAREVRQVPVVVLERKRWSLFGN